MSELALDPERSRVCVRTYAEGMFARLAHDLELVCRSVSGMGRRLDTDARTGSASLDFPVGAIEVAGTLQGGRVDERGLSAGDKRDCLEKMRKDVFQAGPGARVRVEVTLEGASARLRVVPPNGRVVERTIRPAVGDEDGGRVRVRGQVELSLAELGPVPVKGPMNAFRVKDRIEVLFDVVFAPAVTG